MYKRHIVLIPPARLCMKTLSFNASHTGQLKLLSKVFGRNFLDTSKILYVCHTFKSFPFYIMLYDFNIFILTLLIRSLDIKAPSKYGTLSVEKQKKKENRRKKGNQVDRKRLIHHYGITYMHSKRWLQHLYFYLC